MEKVANVLILLQLLSLTKSISSQEFAGYEFTDRSSSNTNNFIIVEPVKSGHYDKGLTLCMRVLFEFWSVNNIFNSTDTALMFSQYFRYEGSLRFQESNYIFALPKSLRFSSWNSICFSINRTSSQAHFSMNGYITKISMNQEPNSSAQVLMVEPALFVGNFTGKVTDLNVWNEPLSQEQLLEFGNGCSNKFSLAKRLSPNVIDWKTRKVIASGNAVRNSSIFETELCK